MQVILLEKVVNLGNLGEIVKVKDGYARNFLIPQGQARRATAANKAEFEAKRAELEKQAASKLTEAQATGEKLASVQSPPLIERLRQMMSESDNVMAESIGREVAAAVGKPQSFDGGGY